MKTHKPPTHSTTAAIPLLSKRTKPQHLLRSAHFAPIQAEAFTKADPDIKQRYVPSDPRKEAQEVKTLLAILHKAYQAFSFYPFNHPVMQQFSDHLYQALHSFFKTAPYLELRLDRFNVLYYDEVVFEERNVNNNFNYLLYSDGIRKLIFYAGLSLDECFRFFAILHKCAGKRSLNDDVVTLMWEESFEHIRYYLVEDLNTTLLPSFAAATDENAASDAPTVRVSRTSAAPSDSGMAMRTVQQLTKTRLDLTPEEDGILQRFLLEEERELMHRFLELMTLIISNHRESPDLEPLIRVLSQLLPIVISVGSIEDMFLCYRYLGHLSDILAERHSHTATRWSQALQRVFPEAYSDEAIQRLLDAINPLSADAFTHSIVSQYIEVIKLPSPEPLLRAFDSLETEEARNTWRNAIAKKYQHAPRKLMPGVSTPSEAVVTATCAILGMLRKEEAWTLLEKASRRSEKGIRIQALKSMLQLEHSDAITRKLLDVIEAYLGDPDPAVRKIALDGLVEMGLNAILLLESMFQDRPYEQWTQEEMKILFEHVVHLCQYYPEIGDLLLKLTLEHYNGRFLGKKKLEIQRIILVALQRYKDNQQTTKVIERLYHRGGKQLQKLCEEMF